MKQLATVSALIALLSPLPAFAASSVMLKNVPTGIRTAPATAGQIHLLAFRTAKSAKRIDARHLFVVINGLTPKQAPMFAAVDLRNLATHRTVLGTLVEAYTEKGTYTGVYRFDDFVIDPGSAWTVRATPEKGAGFTQLQATLCGSMADIEAPCASMDGGSQFQPWAQDLMTGNDVGIAPKTIKGLAVRLRGSAR